MDWKLGFALALCITPSVTLIVVAVVAMYRNRGEL